MNKTTSGLKVKKNDHQVIHRNQWRFIPNHTHRFFCTMGRFYTI